MLKWDGDDGYGDPIPLKLSPADIRLTRQLIAGVVLLFAVAVVWFH